MWFILSLVAAQQRCQSNRPLVGPQQGRSFSSVFRLQSQV
uniref:Uncharacterized protein n=1 Tax=Anguilla anguilla TaxID=7936 RepID=A0A0E9S658_ANGAN